MVFDLSSSFLGSNKLAQEICMNILFFSLDLTESAARKGHFSLYNCLVLGHTKYNGVQRVYSNPFPVKPFYGSHRLEPVIIRPPGLDHGAF
jgi:hypothetical protein